MWQNQRTTWESLIFSKNLVKPKVNSYYNTSSKNISPHCARQINRASTVAASSGSNAACRAHLVNWNKKNCVRNIAFIHYRTTFVIQEQGADIKEVCNRGVACSLLKLGNLEKTVIASLFPSGLLSGTIFLWKKRCHM